MSYTSYLEQRNRWKNSLDEEVKLQVAALPTLRMTAGYTALQSQDLALQILRMTTG